MDEISQRRAIGALAVSKNEPNPYTRDTAGSSDQNPQFCNHLSCNSGILKSMRSAQTGCPRKAKTPKPLYRCSSNGKEIIGSSSRTCSAVCISKRSLLSSLNKVRADSSETSSVQNDPDVSELIGPFGKVQMGRHPQLKGAESCDVTFEEVGSSSGASSARPNKNIHQKFRLSNQERLKVSSVSVTRQSVTGSRYNLKSLKCSSTSDSDVVPSDCSLPESNSNKRKDMVKKRSSEGESTSSIRGKKMSGPSTVEEKWNSSSGHGISISDSRRSRNWIPSSSDNNSSGSVRSRRSANDNSRARLSNQRNLSNLSTIESPVMFQQHGIVGTANAPCLSERFSVGSTSHPNSGRRPGSTSSGNVRNMMAIIPAEVSFDNPSTNHDGLRRYNADGFAEVLLALERIEQDEEITYEQLLLLETSFLLNGLASHDQHNDLRLDIDNMSYEELLDLEERMGTVSTALSEEELTKCLRRSIYHPASLKTTVDYDDVKCCICQEEYLGGDDVGMLCCEHMFHMVCVQQWLRLKNWCPICKASASPGPIPFSSSLA